MARLHLAAWIALGLALAVPPAAAAAAVARAPTTSTSTLAALDLDREGEVLPQTSLVQMKHKLAEGEGEGGAEGDKITSLASPPKVPWLHIPKCGSSLINALTRIPGACQGLPEDLVVSDDTMGFGHHDSALDGFWFRYRRNCGLSLGVVGAGGAWGWVAGGAHFGIGGDREFEETWDGKGVTVLRQPGQRVLSAFYDGGHSWPLSAKNPVPRDPLTFARQEEGCAVRQLTRSGLTHPVFDVPNNFGNVLLPGQSKWGGPCGEGPPPSHEELKEAERRLRGFRFVGLQEEWELSICLFHVTFGGACHAAEFVNSRRRFEEKPLYDEARLLGNWTDVFDGALYQEAERIFWSRFEARGLSLKACQKTCFQRANVTYYP